MWPHQSWAELLHIQWHRTTAFLILFCRIRGTDLIHSQSLVLLLPQFWEDSHSLCASQPISFTCCVYPWPSGTSILGVLTTKELFASSVVFAFGAGALSEVAWGFVCGLQVISPFCFIVSWGRVCLLLHRLFSLAVGWCLSLQVLWIHQW